VSTASTVLQQKSDKGSVGEGFHLLVMAPNLCMSYPLPTTGAIVVGRAKGADVVITDTLASRRHACLHVDPGNLAIEDLASANGTRLRDQKLPPHEKMRLLPGEAITIGNTILMVLPNRVRPAQRSLLSHEEFEGRVEWECARAEATGSGFAIYRMQAVEASTLAATIAETLRPIDLLGIFGPGHYEVLSPGLDHHASVALSDALTRAVCAAGHEVRLGLANYPRDGRHANALLACAGARLASEGAGGQGHVHTLSASPGMQHVFALAERAATGNINVLILGETGAGKEVLAHYIHTHSSRTSNPFVCVDCAALSPSLLESELFGHERGAFTGAGAAKPGLLETAPGGTIFLDEVGEMPLPLQAKLLRAIENREITRVGGVRPRPIDVRFLAATNRDLEAAVDSGAFRRDLYYRLNGMTLTVLPLRERVADIPVLAGIFMTDLCRAEKRRPITITESALAMLCNYAWPGNVRELRNVIERALLLCNGNVLTVDHLPEATLSRPLLAPAPQVEPVSERDRILAALTACAGNQSRAARQLGLSRKVLIARLDSYGVARPRKRPRK
jgi:two-component system response regulator AtoC